MSIVVRKNFGTSWTIGHAWILEKIFVRFGENFCMFWRKMLYVLEKNVVSF